jgi:hypothetical protein
VHADSPVTTVVTVSDSVDTSEADARSALKTLQGYEFQEIREAQSVQDRANRTLGEAKAALSAATYCSPDFGDRFQAYQNDATFTPQNLKDLAIYRKIVDDYLVKTQDYVNKVQDPDVRRKLQIELSVSIDNLHKEADQISASAQPTLDEATKTAGQASAKWAECQARLYTVLGTPQPAVVCSSLYFVASCSDGGRIYIPAPAGTELPPGTTMMNGTPIQLPSYNGGDSPLLRTQIQLPTLPQNESGSTSTSTTIKTSVGAPVIGGAAGNPAGR